MSEPREVPAPDVWNIGRYRAADGVHPWPMRADEWMGDAGAAITLLGRLGGAAGKRALITSQLHEANVVWPLVVSFMATGTQHSAADANEGDAFRTRMFLRMLEYDIVLGLDEPVLDDATLERLRAVPVVAARPGAYERLLAAGLSPHRWREIGPVLAIGDRPDGTAWFDPNRWTVESIDGELVVSSPVERLTPFERLRTGIEGSVSVDDDGGRVTFA